MARDVSRGDWAIPGDAAGKGALCRLCIINYNNSMLLMQVIVYDKNEVISFYIIYKYICLTKKGKY